uniref:UDP-glycosyltransferase 1 n=1 Tax=Linum usitatissimum TaxID=4006 RepID=I2BHA5_LINUS|nr:UDP-glycosyltransferase 1 [Linum usitatissimum]
MLQLSKLLYSRGFHVTFVNTEHNHRRLLETRGSAFFDSLPLGFEFESIPDGLPDDVGATRDIPALCDSLSKNSTAPFRELVNRLNERTPPVSCVVSDGVMAFTLEVADELGIPDVLFWTPSACGVLAYVNYQLLAQRGLVPLKDSSDLKSGYLDTTVDFITGLNKNIRLKDLPSFIRTTDTNNIMFNFLSKEASKIRKASALLINTFDDLEHDALAALSPLTPNLFTVGPVNLLTPHITQNKRVLENINANLWAEQSEWAGWLDSREPNSVLYVSFGSLTVMTPDQLTEFAWGLAMSGVPFLWVIRPDLVSENPTAGFSKFMEETKDRGMLIGWCNQEQVLQHPSIGGFLSHVGWNSMLESLSNGVPMICWPFFAEQQTNCFYACEEWGVGMETDSEVKREEVEKLVREAMGGEKGKEMKRKAMEWRLKAEEATQPGGPSFRNVERLIQVLLQKK